MQLTVKRITSAKNYPRATPHPHVYKNEAARQP